MKATIPRTGFPLLQGASQGAPCSFRTAGPAETQLPPFSVYLAAAYRRRGMRTPSPPSKGVAMAPTLTTSVETAEELNPFRIAMSQFDTAAELLGLEPGLREVLRRPRRALSLSLPVKMDNGTIRVFD